MEVPPGGQEKGRKSGLSWLTRLLLRLADAGHFKRLYLGLPVSEFRARYRLRLTRQDQRWEYIEAQPRLDEDRADFDRTEVVLSQKTHLVRRIWCLQPNGNELTVDFKHVETGVSPPISLKSITADLPRGWKRQTVAGEDQNQKPGPTDKDEDR